MHSSRLRGERVRPSRRWLQRHHQLRWMHGTRDLRWRRAAQRLRLHPPHLPAGRVRHRRPGLRAKNELWCVPRPRRLWWVRWLGRLGWHGSRGCFRGRRWHGVRRCFRGRRWHRRRGRLRRLRRTRWSGRRGRRRFGHYSLIEGQSALDAGACVARRLHADSPQREPHDRRSNCRQRIDPRMHFNL
jgi:hypothetical protein